MHSELENQWWTAQLGELHELHKESISILSQIKSQSISFTSDLSVKSTGSSEEMGPHSFTKKNLAFSTDLDQQEDPANAELRRKSSFSRSGPLPRATKSRLPTLSTPPILANYAH